MNYFCPSYFTKNLSMLKDENINKNRDSNNWATPARAEKNSWYLRNFNLGIIIYLASYDYWKKGHTA